MMPEKILSYMDRLVSLLVQPIDLKLTANGLFYNVNLDYLKKTLLGTSSRKMALNFASQIKVTIVDYFPSFNLSSNLLLCYIVSTFSFDTYTTISNDSS